MSKRKSQKYDAKFKSKVVLEVLRNETTLAQIASRYKTHTKNIQNWRKEFMAHVELVFERNKDKDHYERKYQEQQEKIDELYRLNGKLNAELEWSKKKAEELGYEI